jgi:WD40-like Beta Propeller Repeat
VFPLMRRVRPLSDVAKKVMEILAEFKRDKGYVPVEVFCGQHLEKLHLWIYDLKAATEQELALTLERKHHHLRPFVIFPQIQGATSSASFSPDGKWIAYDSDESGRSEIYVVPNS